MDQQLSERRSLPRRLMPLLIVVVVLGFIVFSRLRASDEGAGAQKPVVSIAFPTTADAGSVETAVIEVTNPAASEIGSLFVSFSSVAAAGGDLPTPIVTAAPRKDSPVLSIEPRPTAVGGGRVRFGFGPLGPGDTRTIRFELRLPETTGPAANSVAVYDGEIPERGTGGSIEVTVEP